MNDGLYQINDPEGNIIGMFYLGGDFYLDTEELKRIKELYFENSEELDIFEDELELEFGLRRVQVEDVNITKP
jgi:hypothetical protein